MPTSTAQRPQPVAPGVAVVPVRSPTLPPATHTNTYVVGDDRVIVVDPASPFADEQARLEAALAEVEVEAIFLTHHHHDHVSGAEALAAATGAPIWAHGATAERLELSIDRRVDEGTRFELGSQTWQALHTPGHATGHLCLWDRQHRSLIAGDMVAGVGTIVLDPPEGHLGDYLASLARLRELDASVLLPAHGPPLGDARALLSHYIDHRQHRTQQYLEVLERRGPLRPAQIVPEVYTDLPAPFYPIAARQVLCHLLWLVEQGRLRHTDPHFTTEI